MNIQDCIYSEYLDTQRTASVSEWVGFNVPPDTV